MFQMTPMVQRLVIANVLVYIAILVVSDSTYSEFFCLHKSGWVIPRGEGDDYPFLPLQIISHFFSHSKGSFFHILFNMLALISFGSRMELVFGAKRFLQFYLFCGVLGGVFITFLDPSPIPVVG
ncbi:MAG: rhomboid family intramembrane serine protease, partial [Bacteroidia bacterium]